MNARLGADTKIQPGVCGLMWNTGGRKPLPVTEDERLEEKNQPQALIGREGVLGINQPAVAFGHAN